MKITFLLLIVLIPIFGFYLFATRKQRRRKKIIQQPFPTAWKEILQSKVHFYNPLTEEEKNRFQQLIQIFIDEKRIIGIKTEIDDEIKVLVAASAIIPVFGFKNWEYDHLGEVFVTDGVVDTLEVDKENKNSVLGKVQPMFGNTYFMTLSKQSLISGFLKMDEENVGIHEFAHILDESDGIMDGIPQSYLPADLVKEWVTVADAAIAKIKHGHSTISEYGATNRAEFFAVTTEYFFEKPAQLYKENPELYSLLQKTYHQNPKKTFNLNFEKIVNPYGKRTDRNAPCPCGSENKFKQCCLK